MLMKMEEVLEFEVEWGGYKEIWFIEVRSVQKLITWSCTRGMNICMVELKFKELLDCELENEGTCGIWETLRIVGMD